MKNLALAIGALALSIGAAQAEPSRHHVGAARDAQSVSLRRQAEQRSYPTAETARPYASSVAGGANTPAAAQYSTVTGGAERGSHAD